MNRQKRLTWLPYLILALATATAVSAATVTPAVDETTISAQKPALGYPSKKLLPSQHQPTVTVYPAGTSSTARGGDTVSTTSSDYCGANPGDIVCTGTNGKVSTAVVPPQQVVCPIGSDCSGKTDSTTSTATATGTGTFFATQAQPVSSTVTYTGTLTNTHALVTPYATKTFTQTATITQGDIATTAPASGAIPMAGTDSKIAIGWLPSSVLTGIPVPYYTNAGSITLTGTGTATATGTGTGTYTVTGTFTGTTSGSGTGTASATATLTGSGMATSAATGTVTVTITGYGTGTSTATETHAGVGYSPSSVNLLSIGKTGALQIRTDGTIVSTAAIRAGINVGWSALGFGVDLDGSASKSGRVAYIYNDGTGLVLYSSKGVVTPGIDVTAAQIRRWNLDLTTGAFTVDSTIAATNIVTAAAVSSIPKTTASSTTLSTDWFPSASTSASGIVQLYSSVPTAEAYTGAAGSSLMCSPGNHQHPAGYSKGVFVNSGAVTVDSTAAAAPTGAGQIMSTTGTGTMAFAAAPTVANQVPLSSGPNAWAWGSAPATSGTQTTLYFVDSATVIGADNQGFGSSTASVTSTPAAVFTLTSAQAPNIWTWVAGQYRFRLVGKMASSPASVYVKIKSGTTLVATTNTVTVAAGGSNLPYDMVVTTTTDTLVGLLTDNLIAEIWASSASTNNLTMAYDASGTSYVSVPWMGYSGTLPVIASGSGNAGTTRLPAMSNHVHPTEGDPSTLPLVNGTASAGTASLLSKADHVHPSDTTKVTKNSYSVSSASLVTGATDGQITGARAMSSADVTTALGFTPMQYYGGTSAIGPSSDVNTSGSTGWFDIASVSLASRPGSGVAIVNGGVTISMTIASILCNARLLLDTATVIGTPVQVGNGTNTDVKTIGYVTGSVAISAGSTHTIKLQLSSNTTSGCIGMQNKSNLSAVLLY